MVLKKQPSNTAFNNKTALPSTRAWDRHCCFVKCSLVLPSPMHEMAMAVWQDITFEHFHPIPFPHYVHEILVVLEQHTPFQISPPHSLLSTSLWNCHGFSWQRAAGIKTIFFYCLHEWTWHGSKKATPTIRHRGTSVKVSPFCLPPMPSCLAPGWLSGLPRFMTCRLQAGKFANLDDSSLPDAALQRVETRFFDVFCMFFWKRRIDLPF